MKKNSKFLIIYLVIFFLIDTQVKALIHWNDTNYHSAFTELEEMLSGRQKQNFKRAVFITENAYLEQKIEYDVFDDYIRKLTLIAQDWMKFNSIRDYRYSDSSNVLKNCSIHRLMTDTTKVYVSNEQVFAHFPYTYDFENFTGKADWRDMFVTKLLAFHTGNCHSLPYLYKILADELGASCWLGLAPNHIYIKNRCKKFGWYNTELTSNSFPVDAWIMGSGYIPIEAVQNGIYMDTLSNQQAIALCVLDLAKGYEQQTHNYQNGFILKCCDLSLQYFPFNVQAMLLKAETLKNVYIKQRAGKLKQAHATYKQMEQLYAKLFEVGYREMPDKMYREWLISVNEAKYANQQLELNMKIK